MKMEPVCFSEFQFSMNLRKFTEVIIKIIHAKLQIVSLKLIYGDVIRYWFLQTNIRGGKRYKQANLLQLT